MFKLIRFELKKMISKPSIYILAILLAVVLVLGLVIYEPSVSVSESFTLNGTDFISKYDNFYDSNAGVKNSADNNLLASINNINHYIVDGKSYKEYADNLIKEFNDAVKLYNECDASITGGVSAPPAVIESNRKQILQKLENISNFIENGLVLKNSYPLVITNSSYSTFSSLYSSIKSKFEEIPLNSNTNKICQEYKNKFHDNFMSCLNSIYYPTLTDEIRLNYTVASDETTKLNIVNARLLKINSDIQTLYNDYQTKLTAGQISNSSNYITSLNSLANKYVDTVNSYIKMQNCELLANAFNIIPTKSLLDLKNIGSDVSKYNNSSLMIKYNYMFESDTTENDYARPLTIGKISNQEKNAYDFAYFSMKLFSFIIIVYAIMSASFTIAGEIKEGSMRYLAVRPIKRSKLLFGKLISILIMSTILIIFSTILSTIIGGIAYGFNSAQILTIFNGKTALTIHPFAMICIFALSLLIEVAVYSSIALLLSCLFKSDVLGVTLLLSLYLINIILPVFAGGINSWLTFYPFSHISLFALFGSSLYADPSNLFNNFFGVKVYTSTNLGLTLSVILIIIIGCNLLSSWIFKRKEL